MKSPYQLGGESSYQLDLGGVVAGAFSLVAALAWNEYAQQAIRHYYPRKGGGSSLKASLVYAIVVTLMVVAVFAAFRAAAHLLERRRPRGGN